MSDLPCAEDTQPGLDPEEDGLPAQQGEGVLAFEEDGMMWDRRISLRGDAVVWVAEFGEAGPELPLGPGGPVGAFNVVTPTVRPLCLLDGNMLQMGSPGTDGEGTARELGGNMDTGPRWTLNG
jgi:hypothetical protein